MPSCPVCLDRLDPSVTGIVTIVCDHTFHCECLRRWSDSSCPVCRHVADDSNSATSCEVWVRDSKSATSCEVWVRAVSQHPHPKSKTLAHDSSPLTLTLTLRSAARRTRYGSVSSAATSAADATRVAVRLSTTTKAPATTSPWSSRRNACGTTRATTTCTGSYRTRSMGSLLSCQTPASPEGPLRWTVASGSSLGLSRANPNPNP